MVQARQLGNELYAGVHSDEEILANKGPTVMTLAERYAKLTTATPKTKHATCTANCSLGWQLPTPVDG